MILWNDIAYFGAKTSQRNLANSDRNRAKRKLDYNHTVVKQKTPDGKIVLTADAPINVPQTREIASIYHDN